MLGTEFNDIERSGTGCGFFCRCEACVYDDKMSTVPKQENKDDGIKGDFLLAFERGEHL